MEEKESEKKYIKYTPDPVEPPFYSFSSVDKAITQFVVDIQEEQDRLIMQRIQHIGGKRYEHITIDRDKTLEALDNAIPKKPCRVTFKCRSAKHFCISCMGKLMNFYKYCPNCGQNIDWSEVQGD